MRTTFTLFTFIRHGLLFLAVPALGAAIAHFAVWEDVHGNLVTSLNTGWGDMLVHIRAAVFFAEQGGWPRESFFLSGQPVGYAFLADLISGLLWRAGLSIAAAFAWPTMLLSSLTLLGIELLAYYFTRSRAAACLSALLFLTFGGLSGWPALAEILTADSDPVTALRTLPHGITAWGEIHANVLNPFVTMLHQRSYLVGFPVFLLTAYLTARWTQHRAIRQLAGIAAGGLLLAFAHPFTWLAFLLMLPAWIGWTLILRIYRYRRKELLMLAGVAALVAAGGFLIIKSLQPAAGSSPITWQPGWIAPGAAWPLLWLQSIGLYTVLGPMAIMYLLRYNRPLAAFTLAGLTPFLLANLFKFTPWDWDNNKLFTATWLVLTIAVAGSGVDVLHRHRQYRYRGAGIASLVLVALMISGGLENLRIFAYYPEPTYISSPKEYQLGESIRRLTKPQDLILTGPQAHNVAFIYSGRPSLVAYEGWLWSNGWQGYAHRIRDTAAIYAGARNAPALLRHYGIDYVAIGPPEIAGGANRAWFEANFPLVLRQAETELYAITLPPAPATR